MAISGPGSLQRRLRATLALFSLVPTVLLFGAGAALLALVSEGSRQGAASVEKSGAELVSLARSTGDPALARSAERHRRALDAAASHDRRTRRAARAALLALPVVALAVAGLLLWLATRRARRVSTEWERPVRELTDRAERIGRGEAPPPAGPTAPGDAFAVLRATLDDAAARLRDERERALDEERTRLRATLTAGVGERLARSTAPLLQGARALDRHTQGLRSAREPLQVVLAEAARLDALARDLAGLTAPVPDDPADVDLRALVEELLQTPLPHGVASRLRVPFDLPRIRGDREALARALSALLHNAAEAMAESGGTVIVTLSTVRDAVELRVLDTGPGFAEADLERIWTPEHTTRSGGAGLGLPLARRVVQAHGGGIWARNRREGGGEIRILLPIHDRSEPPADPS